jgi:Spy/CpxP family protein refolding chaperone
MRPLIRWSLIAVFVALFAAPVFAQIHMIDVVARLQEGVDLPVLIATERVTQDLKLTDEQLAKFRKIARDVTEKNQGNMLKALKEGREKMNKAIPEVLSAEQLKRLHQIRVQVNGIVPFSQPEVQKQLKLTDKQKEEIDGIADELKQDIRKTVQAANNLKERVQALQKKVPELRREAAQKAAAVLTEEQKKTWSEMAGDKFDYDFDLMKASSGRRPPEKNPNGP